MSPSEARRRIALFHDASPGWCLEGTPSVRQRRHNQKYFTWVEQQGKSIEELESQKSPEYWRREQQRIPEIDAALLAARQL